jgi:hypothetical protein
MKNHLSTAYRTALVATFLLFSSCGHEQTTYTNPALERNEIDRNQVSTYRVRNVDYPSGDFKNKKRKKIDADVVAIVMPETKIKDSDIWISDRGMGAYYEWLKVTLHGIEENERDEIKRWYAQVFSSAANDIVEDLGVPVRKTSVDGTALVEFQFRK